MIDFSEIVESVKDFYREKTLPAILISIVVLLFFLALIIFVVQGCNSSKKQPTIEEAPLVLDNDLMLPDGPSIPDGYALTREPKEKWTKEESQEYFTMPDKEELLNLEYTNDKLIEDILGATP